MDSDTFKAALSRYCSGVTVITCGHAGGVAGLTATAFNSLSLDPPLVLFCLGDASSTFDDFAQAEGFAVHILAEHQDDLSNRFARSGPEKFEGLSYRTGTRGQPLLDGCLAVLQCRVVQRHPGGDHVIYVGEVEAAEIDDGRPLLYFGGRYHRL